MKFACIADIHFSRYSQDKIEDSSNLPERLYSIRSTLDQVVEYCRQNDIKTIVVAGDILHNKSIIYTVAQDIMLQFFEDTNDIFFYVIDGNHDLSGKGENVVSALRPLKLLQNVKWISFKETYSTDNILFVPYSSNIVSTITENTSKILVSHFGLDEGLLNSDISIVSDIKLTQLIGRYDLVLLGHYHKPQEIIRDDISLYYTGSIIQLDWGEKNDQKRFLVVDTETLEVESIPTTGYKKHIELEIDSSNRDEVLDFARKSKENGDHVHVIMTENVDLNDVKNEFNIIDKTEVDITNRGITRTMSQADRLTKYLEIKEIPEKIRKSYLDIGIEIIDACEVQDQ